MQDIVQQGRSAMTPCVGSPNVNDVQVIKLLIAGTIRKILKELSSKKQKNFLIAP